ncbi:MAG: histidinol-phosphate transaminase [Clostridia bacterium]|nr:histidinol-phosphate transaminase [Clostridia bacterium]
MSRFFSPKHAALDAYVPGEQPRDRKYIKLNTNESPFPPHPAVAEAVAMEAGQLQLYSDPTMKALTEATAATFGVAPEQVLMVNGSDEALNFAFWAFCDESHPIAYPAISYGFYSVFCALHHIPAKEIPLREDFSIDYRDYCGIGCAVVIANPNAPTGLALPLSRIEEIVKSNPDHPVIIDEAYVDFGAESAVSLLPRYPNLIVIGTFSKSRSLAGARLGFAIASPEIIRNLNTIKYSTNPYNVNRMTAAAGIATLAHNDVAMANCRTIAATRERVKTALRALGFTVTDSKANFLFAAHATLGGEELYKQLRSRGILIRHFSTPAIANYNRITVGTDDEMDTLIAAIRDILASQRKED